MPSVCWISLCNRAPIQAIANQAREGSFSLTRKRGNSFTITNWLLDCISSGRAIFPYLNSGGIRDSRVNLGLGNLSIYPTRYINSPSETTPCGFDICRPVLVRKYAALFQQPFGYTHFWSILPRWRSNKASRQAASFRCIIVSFTSTILSGTTMIHNDLLALKNWRFPEQFVLRS